MRNFRILMVDEKESVLNIVWSIVGQAFEFRNEKYNISLCRLKAKTKDGEHRFCEDTISDLNYFCKKPFDIFLINLEFIAEEIVTNNKFPRIIKLMPAQANNTVSNGVGQDSHTYKEPNIENINFLEKINTNFLKHNSKVFFYSYKSDITNQGYSIDSLIDYFPNTQIEVVSSQNKLFYDVQSKYNYEEESYPYFVCQILSKIVHDEIIKKLNERYYEQKQKSSLNSGLKKYFYKLVGD